MTTTVAIKELTIRKLDKIAEKKIYMSIKNKTFNVSALVKNKRGISYDKEILYLAKFYEICICEFEKINIKKPHKCIINETLIKIDKMNCIA